MQYLLHKTRKERDKLKIIIEADSKEIADLVLKLQNRHIEEKEVELYPNPKDLVSTLAESIRDMCEAN